MAVVVFCSVTADVLFAFFLSEVVVEIQRLTSRCDQMILMAIRRNRLAGPCKQTVDLKLSLGNPDELRRACT